MASQATVVTLGVDVSKDWLEICQWPQRQVVRIANQAGAIRRWLAGYARTATTRLAFEPTASYHRNLVEVAQEQGAVVYLVNPRQLHHYRYSVGLRHKSDRQDAWLLARYLAHEGAALRPHQPHDARSQHLWALLKRRGKVVQAAQQLRQSLAGTGVSCQAVLTQLQRLVQRLDVRIEQLLEELGWSESSRRCRTLPGIGPVSAAALVAAYHRGVFASADAFVAYLGLDVRLRESGRMRGRRRLTKHGDPETRRVLYCASHAARHDPHFAAYYQKQRDKGLSATAARVVLTRKLVRIAFALLSRNTTYQRTAAGA